MSTRIKSAITSALTAALAVTPTDGRDVKYFQALNKVANAEFVKAGFNPSVFDGAKWKPAEFHNKYWVASLINLKGLAHFAYFNMLFEDGSVGYVLKGFSIKINSVDDNFKPTELLNTEVIKDFDTSTALIAGMVAELRKQLKKLGLEAAFEIQAVEDYADFSNVLGRLSASRGGSIDWIPSLTLSSISSLSVRVNSGWQCTSDFSVRRSDVIKMFTDFSKAGKLEIPLEYSCSDKILNPKTLADTLLEIFPSLTQNNDLVVLSLKDAKFSGSSLKVTFIFKKK